MRSQLPRVAPWLFVVVASGCASLQPSSLRGPSPSLISRGVSPIRTVVVDAGHGGHDPGAIYHGFREKDLTLDIARRLKAELQGQGLAVVMTRDRDEFLVLSRRPNVANRLQADFFVSVHVNANKSRKVSGIEVYYPRESAVDASAPFPPSIELAEVWLPTTRIKQILWDLVLTRTRRHAARMALHICRTMRSRLHVRCRWVRGARFVVLREARVPAVLVEVGYMSNQREAARLGQASYRQAIAQAIAEGLIAYVRELGLEHI